MKAAAIGIGSNSLRMLVAEIADGNLTQTRRYRQGLRVFAALDENGNIGCEMMENACRSILAFKNEALEQGAQEVHLFATSATRDAANQADFIRAIESFTGLKLHVCSGEEEARLSFRGAVGTGAAGLIDIGGGSTELVIGCGGRIEEAVSLQMGAVRLYRQIPIACAADAEKAAGLAGEILAPVKARFDRNTKPVDWVGVGGTFTTSAAVVQRVPWKQRQYIHHFVMAQDQVKAVMDFLADLPMAERLKLDCLQPQRADIVVHGIAILLACMRQLHIPAIKVSECGNLDGYLKEKYIR